MAILIALFYIRPTIVAIGVTQDEIQTYQTEITKIADVNTQLASLVAQMNSVSTQNQTALVRYLPDQVDVIAVLKDLQVILFANQVINPVVEHVGLATTGQQEDDLLAQEFSVSAFMTYPQLKSFLRAVEQNNYLLEVTELSAEVTDGGLLDVMITFRAYQWSIN